MVYQRFNKAAALQCPPTILPKIMFTSDLFEEMQKNQMHFLLESFFLIKLQV